MSSFRIPHFKTVPAADSNGQISTPPATVSGADIMHCDTSATIQLHFLEALNHELRLKAATMTLNRQRSARQYLPMFLVSGFASFSAWTLSWLS